MCWRLAAGVFGAKAPAGRREVLQSLNKLSSKKLFLLQHTQQNTKAISKEEIVPFLHNFIFALHAGLCAESHEFMPENREEAQQSSRLEWLRHKFHRVDRGERENQQKARDAWIRRETKTQAERNDWKWEEEGA